MPLNWSVKISAPFLWLFYAYNRQSCESRLKDFTKWEFIRVCETSRIPEKQVNLFKDIILDPRNSKKNHSQYALFDNYLVTFIDFTHITTTASTFFLLSFLYLSESWLISFIKCLYIFAGFSFCKLCLHVIWSSLHCVSLCGISHDATGEALF